MSETKWTPGHRSVSKRDGSAYILAGDYATQGEPDLFVVVISEDPEADATVMAAAPDLYEALELATIALEAAVRAGIDDMPSLDMKQVRDDAVRDHSALRQMRWALAKARGEM